MTTKTLLTIFSLGAVAYVLIAFLSQQPQAVSTMAVQPQAAPSPWVIVGLLGFYTIAILIIAFLIKRMRTGLAAYLIVSSILMIGIAVFDASIMLGLPQVAAAAIALSMIIIYIKFSRKLQLPFTFFITVVLALVIGLSFTFFFALVLLMFFSVFDYIAVKHSNYMVNLAKMALSSRMALPLILKVGKDIPKDVNLRESKGTFSILGAGDIVIPGILIASVHSPIGYIFSAAACLGLGLDMLWVRKQNGAIPALPIIAICMIAVLAALIVI
jgi:presenilin-like A22 family membrane protease